MQPIKRGDGGDRVADVQARLAALGFGTSEKAGSFGEATEHAVRMFQDTRGLVVDGIVGRQTWRELVEASWRLGDRVLYLRSPNLRGDDVRDLQDRLTTLGFDVWRADGIFGPRTASAVREFQQNIGLHADGIVAESSYRALRGLPRITGDTTSAEVRDRESLRTRPGGVSGMRIVLDPGHGGDDAGHVGAGGAREADLSFAIARGVESSLGASGAQVYVTRPTHDAPEDSLRATLANVVEADLFVSIHLGGEERGPGALAYYFGHERYRSEPGRHLAELLLSELARLELPGLGAHPKTIAVLRETRMTAVQVQPGHVDDERLPDVAYHLRAAEAIATGIRRFAREPVVV